MDYKIVLVNEKHGITKDLQDVGTLSEGISVVDRYADNKGSSTFLVINKVTEKIEYYVKQDK